jgi:hypothetical protein
MADIKQICINLIELWEEDFDIGEEINELRVILAQPENPECSEVERVAQIVFEAMRFSAGTSASTPPWVEGGNSLMQDCARKAAHDILNR